MAKPRMTFVVCLCIATALSGVTLAEEIARPSRFLPNLDGELARSTNALDGSTWAAWTYTNGSETDIAVSRRFPGEGWSEPQIVGFGDRRDQRQPALTVDEYGTTYLAFSEADSGRIFVSAMGLDALNWTTPSPLNPVGSDASAPAVMIAANRKLVVGFIIDGRVNLRELSLLPPVIVGNGGNDGPDVFGNSMWPPEAENDKPKTDDELIDGANIWMELEFTNPSRRGRQRSD